ncbi:hypothetical protein [Streptomyces filamentosus]|uniref:hypothetical protein n=1 Tax=Streptomyces filamentosus TaxID=67294 RepID=UPI0033D70E8A
MSSYTRPSLPDTSVWDAFVGAGFAAALQDGLSRARLSTRPRPAADRAVPERPVPQLPPVCPGAHGLCRLSPARNR